MKKYPIHVNKQTINKMLPDMPESFGLGMHYLIVGMPYRELEKPMKRKLSVGLVLAIVLIVVALTALAVTLLSPREIVEEYAMPIASLSEGDAYSVEETNVL